MAQQLAQENIAVAREFPCKRQVVEEARCCHEDEARAKRRAKACPCYKGKFCPLKSVEHGEKGECDETPEGEAQRIACLWRISVGQSRCKAARTCEARPEHDRRSGECGMGAQSFPAHER